MTEHGRMNARVAHRLRTMRLILGLSQNDLAAKLEFSAQQLHNYETGKSRITLDILEQVSDALGKSIDPLFDTFDPSLSEISKLLTGLEHQQNVGVDINAHTLHELIGSLSSPEFSEVKEKLYKLIQAITKSERVSQKN